MNDLAYVVKRSSLSAYANDTQIFYPDQDPIKVEETINANLSSVDGWYKDNGMKRNSSKYQAIVMGRTHTKPTFHCENTNIPICDELLGVIVDNKLNLTSTLLKYAGKYQSKLPC